MCCWRALASPQWEGLKGKTIAASAPGSPPDVVAHASLAAFKVPDQEVRFCGGGGRSRSLQRRFLGGVVDAAVVADEYTPLASSKTFNLLAQGAAGSAAMDPVLHAHQRQGARRAAPGCGRVPDRADQGVSGMRCRTARRPSSSRRK